MVWYQTEWYTSFYKLYGRVNEKLPKGSYTVQVANLFQVHQFDGKKFFYLSEMNALGGRNPLLGVFMLIAGVVCLAIAGYFAYLYKTVPYDAY